ncbi:hypothetical protein FRX31_020378 [Thalictrum thalictroides]|uniref:Uncharacterized protein n=1 Tax=Thalictrum thalictroides TaxID=46969 RepID=A0A7J6VY28_THATH|nr:hypothetical protein FRX31_020378 [Thalictrum thalictroides]
MGSLTRVVQMFQLTSCHCLTTTPTYDISVVERAQSYPIAHSKQNPSKLTRAMAYFHRAHSKLIHSMIELTILTYIHHL